MGSRNQLFRIGAFFVFEAGLERIRGLREHARTGGKIAGAGAARCRAKPLSPCGSFNISFRVPIFLFAHARCCKALASTGSLRSRLPVAAKMAFATAGASADVPGSPMPPGASVLSTMYTSILGASPMRSIL